MKYCYALLCRGCLLSLALSASGAHGSSDIDIGRLIAAYPYSSARGWGVPQRLAISLSLGKEEFGDLHLTARRSPDRYSMSYRLVPGSAMSSRSSDTCGELRVTVRHSSRGAYHTALRVLAICSRLPRAERECPVGDWCVVSRSRNGDAVPGMVLFTRNNVVIRSRRSRGLTQDQLWKFLRLVDRAIERQSTFVRQPDTVKWVGITDRVVPYAKGPKSPDVPPRKLPSDIRESLPARGSVSLSTKVFAPEEICDVDARSANYVRVDLIRRSDAKTTRGYVKTWIHPSVADAEKAFVDRLEREKFPPEWRLKEGPGRVCYGERDKNAICFLMANVVYYSEGKGFDQI